MSLVDNGGNGMVMPVSPMGGYGNGYGMNGGDWLWWIIVLFLFGFNNNGWGNGNNGYQTAADVQRGFDQQALTSGINDIQQTLANNQMGIYNQLNTIAMAQQNCCCENRAAIADVKYAIANEGAATRTAISQANQSILDKLCQQEIDALKEQNANLRTQLNLANLASSQNAQTSKILADNAAQTQALEQYLNPTPIPAYMVQNPNCCCSGNNFCG